MKMKKLHMKYPIKREFKRHIKNVIINKNKEDNFVLYLKFIDFIKIWFEKESNCFYELYDNFNPFAR